MKIIVFLLTIASFLTGCYHTDQQLAGTLIGAHVGGVLGSAILGSRHDYAGAVLGDVVGTVAGAAIGNALTAPREPASSPHVESYPSSESQQNETIVVQRRPSYRYEQVRRNTQEAMSGLKVQNLRFIDANHNRTIEPQEDCQLLFDICNEGKEALDDIAPCVYVADEDTHITINQPEVIQHIEPGERVHCIISFRADDKLRTGMVTFCIEVINPDGLAMPCREFDLPTVS